MTHSVSVNKDMRGSWMAKSAYPLDAERQMEMTTMKRHNGDLVTSVMVGTVDRGMFTYMPYSDFNRTLIQRHCRVTETAVKDQHEQAERCVTALLLEAKAFYAAKDKSVSGTQEPNTV